MQKNDFKKIRSITLDARASNKQRAKGFHLNVGAEREFIKALKKVARASAALVDKHVDGHKVEREEQMMKSLENYSKILTPWAERQAAKMLYQVSKKSRKAYTTKAYNQNANLINQALKTQVAEADVGITAAALMREQVALIKSIPLEAGLRAQKLAREAIFNGSRASEIATELQKTEKVTESRAELIARTETARANSALIQARSSALGARRYIWRNSGDGAVRESHDKYHGQKMDGQIFSWDKPPKLDDGTVGHPGTFPNCRCYPEPLFDDE